MVGIRLALFAMALTCVLVSGCEREEAAAPPPATASPPASLTPRASPPRAPLVDESVVIGYEVRFRWPIAGKIVTYFEAGRTSGVDIALTAGRDSLIRASTDGVVSVVGEEICCGLGRYLEITHPGGKTVYGHLEKALVTAGQTIKQGDEIALGDSAGAILDPTLRFELYEGGTPVDPLRFLPQAQDRVSRSTSIPTCRTDSIRLEPSSRYTLRFLANSSGYAISNVELTSLTGDGQELTLLWEQAGPLRLILHVPFAPPARGEVLQGFLTVTFEAGEERHEMECHLFLTPWLTLGNPSPTPTVTNTPGPRTSRTPTPTATRTPALRLPSTLTPRPTRTPVKAPTVLKPQMPATPTPQPTATP